MELLGTTPNELLFVLFLLGLVLLGTKVGDIGAALGRWRSGRGASSARRTSDRSTSAHPSSDRPSSDRPSSDRRGR